MQFTFEHKQCHLMCMCIYIYTLMMNVGIINGAWQILHSLTYRKDRFLYIGIQRFKDISAYARCLHSACTYAFGVFRYQDSTIHQEPTNKKTKPVNYYYCRMTEQPKYHEMYVYSGFKSTFVQIKSTKKAIIIIYIYIKTISFDSLCSDLLRFYTLESLSVLCKWSLQNGCLKKISAQKNEIPQAHCWGCAGNGECKKSVSFGIQRLSQTLL